LGLKFGGLCRDSRKLARNLLKTGGNGWPFQRPEEPIGTVFVSILCPCLFEDRPLQLPNFPCAKNEDLANIYKVEAKKKEQSSAPIRQRLNDRGKILAQRPPLEKMRSKLIVPRLCLDRALIDCAWILLSFRRPQKALCYLKSIEKTTELKAADSPLPLQRSRLQSNQSSIHVPSEIISTMRLRSPNKTR